MSPSRAKCTPPPLSTQINIPILSHPEFLTSLRNQPVPIQNCSSQNSIDTAKTSLISLNLTMPQKELVFTDKAPPPLPFFSQAVKYNGMVYCSGNIGLNPTTMKMVEGSVAERTVGIATFHQPAIPPSNLQIRAGPFLSHPLIYQSFFVSII